MSTAIKLGCLVLAILFLVSPRATAGDEERERRDKRKHDQLVRDWRQVAAERGKVAATGLKEARENGGKAKAETLARLANLMDREDRILSHIEEITLRNGWEMPQTRRQGGAEGDLHPGLGGIFTRADGMVREALAREARAIAAALRLPATPLEGEASAN